MGDAAAAIPPEPLLSNNDLLTSSTFNTDMLDDLVQKTSNPEELNDMLNILESANPNLSQKINDIRQQIGIEPPIENIKSQQI